MQIRLQNIVPAYLEKEKVENSQVWEKEFVIKKGEKIQIVAPSGSGKTSLMHIIYGIRRDYTGNLFYENNNINNFDIEKFSAYRQNKISIVFQDLRLFPTQTVRENLVIKKQLDPFPGAVDITDMARRLGIENKLDRLARTCSYGEQQRVAIIRSLQQPFDILLLDEPFSHLDDKNRSLAMNLMLEEAEKRNAAIVYADLKSTEYFTPDKLYLL
ncbi:MAG: ATP-binding cassette domain-containing protein [Chitinophagaceae bacterium]